MSVVRRVFVVWAWSCAATPSRRRRYVALKVVKSELKYAEAAMDEIELLLKVRCGGGR